MGDQCFYVAALTQTLLHLMALSEFIGRIHPALVHFPIVLLLTAVAFEWLGRWKRYRKLKKSIKFLLTSGFIAALAACLTGLLHEQSGEFDAHQTSFHQWLGIAVTVLAFIALLLRGRKEQELRVGYVGTLVSLTIVVILAGHAGAEITYGKGFLNPAQLFSFPEKKSLSELRTAYLYKDVIAPILQEKCYQCHGANRQKGKLRLDEPDFILKGGKDGIVVGKEQSELLDRIQLPLDDDDHMPPKEKRQLTDNDIRLIAFWLNSGPDFTTRLSDLKGADSLIRELGEESHELAIAPMPNERVLETLRRNGVVVSFITQGNGVLSLNFLNADSSQLKSSIKSMAEISRQVVELKMSGIRLNEGDWPFLGKMQSLIRLRLDGTNVGRTGIDELIGLPSLESVNLTNTSVTATDIKKLAGLPRLKNLFLFRSAIRQSDQESLRRLFPHTNLDFGNYEVPTFASDTSVQTKPYVAPR
jgi:uncharacterized membrane protein/mono/diheme cytochrome c family protein